MWLVSGTMMYKVNVRKMEFEIIEGYTQADYTKYSQRRNPSNNTGYTKLS